MKTGCFIFESVRRSAVRVVTWTGCGARITKLYVLIRSRAETGEIRVGGTGDGCTYIHEGITLNIYRVEQDGNLCYNNALNES